MGDRHRSVVMGTAMKSVSDLFADLKSIISLNGHKSIISLNGEEDTGQGIKNNGIGRDMYGHGDILIT